MATLKQQFLTLLHFQPLWRLILMLSVIVIGFLATTSSDYPVPSAPSDKVNHFMAFLNSPLLPDWPGRIFVFSGMRQHC